MLITLTVGVVIATLGVGAIDSLAVFFVPANLYVTASWLGPLIAAFGAGAIAGALLTGPVARRVPFARIFWLGLVLSGTGLVAFSRSTQLQAAIGILCLCGVTRRMVNTVITPLLWERHRSTFSAGSAP